MKSTALCVCLLASLPALLFADVNLRIADAGLHGYAGAPTAVRLMLKNPSSQAQPVRVQVTVTEGWDVTNTASADVNLGAEEERVLELPVLISGFATKITAVAYAGGSVIGHDISDKALSREPLVALMCASESICQSAQSQIEFSGSIQERADKNRSLRFATINDPREDWWAYAPAKAMVLATPLATFTAEQRGALDGYLRGGGRLILVEDAIADPDFLSAYRKGPPTENGEPVGKGTLFRVPGRSRWCGFRGPRPEV